MIAINEYLEKFKVEREKKKGGNTYLNDLMDQIFQDFEGRAKFFALWDQSFDAIKYENLYRRFFIQGNQCGDVGKIKSLWTWAKDHDIMGEQFLKALTPKP